MAIGVFRDRIERMKQVLFLSLIILLGACGGPYANRAVDKVVVKKSENKMMLMKKGEPIRTYHIALGANPIGHKVQEGDQRTPEGRYLLNYKNTKSKFYKSINIDYPNERDIARAKRRGVDPGDDIVIHGLPNELGNYQGELEPVNWTQGCIGVRNHEMDEIWQLVEVDTPIEILP